MKCETCDKPEMSFSWTDTHGVAQCTTCGTPYRLLHYDDAKQRIEKGPESIVAERYKPILRDYWSQYKRIIPSGCSFPGGYELASQEDTEHFGRFFNERADMVRDERETRP